MTETREPFEEDNSFDKTSVDLNDRPKKEGQNLSLTLLVDEKIERELFKRVEPILQLRGFNFKKGSLEELRRILKLDDFVNLWEIALETPAAKAQINVNFKPKRPAFLFDAIVDWDKRDWNKEEGEVALTVQNVFGRTSYCKRATEGQTTSAPIPPVLSHLLAVSNESITLLAVRHADLDCFIVVDVWPNEKVPLNLASQRIGQQFNLDSSSVNVVDAGKSLVTDCVFCDSGEPTYCEKCRGRGTQQVKYCEREDGFFSFSSDKSGSQVANRVASDRVKLKIEGLQKVRQNETFSILTHLAKVSAFERSLSPRSTKEVRETQNILGQASTCLRKAVNAQEDEQYHGAPIELSYASSTTSRHRRRAIYDFQIVGRNGRWQRLGTAPFKESTSLELIDTETSLPLNLDFHANKKVTGKASSAKFLKVMGASKDMVFRIEFPVEIQLNDLPETFSIRPALIPPGEKTQIDYLNRFSSPRNINHAGLRSMVSEEASSSVEISTFFDSSIANNPAQAKAVNMGLSETGLSLLKGPPGTGKTTVIVEIVRQRIQLGQKVLVTSKNHQAVVNVLEKLDAVGGIRMSRHGTSKDPGEIESRYLDGSVRLNIHDRVFEKSSAKLDELSKRKLLLEQFHKNVQSASTASRELSLKRKDAEAETLQSTREAELGTQNAKGVFEESIFEIESRMPNAQKEFDSRKKKAESNLRRQRRQLNGSKKRSTNIDIQISSREDKNSPKKVSWLRSSLDQLSPDFLATTTSLKSRKIEVLNKTKLLQQSIAKETLLVTKLTEKMESIVAAAKRAKDESRLKFETISNDLAKNHQATVEGIDRRLKKNESALLRPQQEAIPVAEAFEIPCKGDHDSDYWNSLDELVQAKHTRVSKMKTFVESWVRDLEADSASVGKCYWENLQVFFSTCVGVASWKALIQSGMTFDYAIVDEAATVTTGESIIPLKLATAGMLVGDEMQLPPHDTFRGKLCSETCRPMPDSSSTNLAKTDLVKNPKKQGQSCWLSKSFFEWLWRGRPNMSRVMLNTQYRMNPRIASFVSDMFYNGRLQSGVSEADRTLGFAEFTEPICLVSTSAYSNSDKCELMEAATYQNHLEARMVRQVVMKAEQHLSRPADFGIISPYAGQVQLIQNELRTELPTLKKVRLSAEDIASVNSFQGSQRDVIIVSFTRSPKRCPRCKGQGRKAGQKCTYHPDPKQENYDAKNAGGGCRGRGWIGSSLQFVQDLQRLNVALSRAKSMVILIGDIEALTAEKYSWKFSQGRKILEAFEKYVTNSGLVLRVWEHRGGSEE